MEWRDLCRNSTIAVWKYYISYRKGCSFLYISYSDIAYYRTFHQAAKEVLETINHVMKEGTYFVSHTDADTFSIIKLLDTNGMDFREGIRMPLEEAY